MWCVDLNKNPNGWIWKHWHVISHNLWICNISKIVERCLVCTLHHSVTVKPQSLAVAVCKHCCNYYPEGDVLLQTCFTPVALDKMWLLWWSWPSPPFRSELERYRKDISSTTLPRSVTSMWTYCLLTKDGARTSVQTCNNTRLWLRAKKPTETNKNKICTTLGLKSVCLSAVWSHSASSPRWGAHGLPPTQHCAGAQWGWMLLGGCGWCSLSVPSCCDFQRKIRPHCLIP